MENPKVILFSILFLGGLYIIRWLISKSVNSAGNAIQKSLDKHEQAKDNEQLQSRKLSDSYNNIDNEE